MAIGTSRIFEISIFIVVGFALLLSTIVISYQQAPTTTNTPTTQPTVKITSLKAGDSVPISGNLTVKGTSSDSGNSTCQVSLIINDVKPYQTALATGKGGPSDYSQWKFTVTPNYTAIKEGQNKITSKVVCPGAGAGTELTKWFGINVTGVKGAVTMAAANSSSSGSQTTKPSNQSSGGPLYSYSQKQAENKKSPNSEKLVQEPVKSEIQQKNKTQSESTVTVIPSNNQTGTSSGLVPPFSP